MRTTRQGTVLVLAGLLGAAACGSPETDATTDEVPVEQTPPAGVAELPADTGSLPGTDPGADPAPRAPGGAAPQAPPGPVVPGAPVPPAQQPATTTPAPDPGEPLRGRVRVTGTAQEPITTIAVDGAGSLIVTGRYETDLRTLSGAVVSVRGTQAGVQRRTIDVASYEIVEVDGARPFVGQILQDGRFATGTDTLSLTGATADMRRGARVWVVGERTGSTLRVSSAGRIGVQ